MEDSAVFCKTHAPHNEAEFWRYPSHKVLGVFDDPKNVANAIESLRKLGIEDNAIEVECGRKGEEHIDISGRGHGLFAQFIRSFQELSAEHSYLEYYQKELHDGNYLVEVRVKNREEKGCVAKAMHDSLGKRVTYFGIWLIEEIANKAEHFETGGYSIGRIVAISFSQAVDRITELLKDEGFGILTAIDMKAKFKEKLDKDFDNYLILGACNPDYAFNALNFDLELGLLLPCNVIVFEKAGETVVAAIDPVRMMSVADNEELTKIAGEVEKKLRRAIDRL
jgi:uncharacterized protein (DUF302 family)